MERSDLKTIFGKFAGLEVPLVKKTHKIEIGGKTREIIDYRLPEGNQVIEDIKQTAATNGLSTRIWTPGSFGTMDWNPNRINVYIEQADDGKWRVKNEFVPG